MDENLLKGDAMFNIASVRRCYSEACAKTLKTAFDKEIQIQTCPIKTNDQVLQYPNIPPKQAHLFDQLGKTTCISTPSFTLQLNNLIELSNMIDNVTRKDINSFSS